jgi:hypothetical protein
VRRRGGSSAGFRVLVPDNMSAVLADADALNPRLTVGWLDYAQHCGFVTDTTRVRRAKDKEIASYCAPCHV